MEIPEKDFWDDSYYQEWRLKNIKITKITRQTFNNFLKHGIKKNVHRYGVDWKRLVETLRPFPEDIKNYHVDHIIPLSNFNFLHEDDSINITEIKKAWSPVNLRFMKKEENMAKHNWVNTLAWPFRFEFLFDDKNKSDALYNEFKILRQKQKEDMRNMVW